MSQPRKDAHCIALHTNRQERAGLAPQSLLPTRTQAKLHISYCQFCKKSNLVLKPDYSRPELSAHYKGHASQTFPTYHHDKGQPTCQALYNNPCHITFPHTAMTTKHRSVVRALEEERHGASLTEGAGWN